MDVQEAVAYGLIGGFGILVITIAACLIYLYWRRREIWLQEEQLYEQSKPKVPPDEGLDGAYPADFEPIPYPEYPEPMPYPEYPPPSADPDIILVPPVVAPLPPVDYEDDARRLPRLRPRVSDSDDSDEERDKKRRKKKRERKDSSSSDSSTSSEESTCCCETSECHCHNHNMTPSMMLLVQPMAPPPPQPVAVPAMTGMTMFTAAPVVARGIEDQTKVAIVGVTPVPCTPPCGF